MRRTLSTLHWILITFFLASCSSPVPAPTPVPASSQALYLFRPSPPTLLQLSPDLSIIAREIPIQLPPDCPLGGLYASPRGDLLVAEVYCSNGPQSSLVDPYRGTLTALLQDTGVDSHFLAWSADGQAVYLRVGSLGSPYTARVDVETLHVKRIPVNEFTYDLSASPDGRYITATFSRGFGFGSEVWLAQGNGNAARPLLADPGNYLSFARWSPDGTQIAFIKIPDSQTPFTVGGLWVMKADGTRPRKLADADAGHGYAFAWSPDGTRIAFVTRSNPQELRANTSVDALLSDIVIAEVQGGAVTQVTCLQTGRAESPLWSPDGNYLVFPVVVNGRMDIQIADLAQGVIKAPLMEPACCPVWMRK